MRWGQRVSPVMVAGSKHVEIWYLKDISLFGYYNGMLLNTITLYMAVIITLLLIMFSYNSVHRLSLKDETCSRLLFNGKHYLLSFTCCAQSIFQHPVQSNTSYPQLSPGGIYNPFNLPPLFHTAR